MRDLILITAFCPTKDKEKMLKELISFIRNYNKLFDIIVSSHSILSPDIVEMCDYYIYDKDNLLLSDDRYRQKMWFKTSQFVINSNYVTRFSTQYTALKLTSMGVTLSKTLGYQKIHKIEYDTEMTSVVELINNSKLLDDRDVIFYTKNGNHNEPMIGSLWSANIEKLPKLYFSFIKNDIINFMYSTDENRVEILIQREFLKNNFLCKNVSELINNGIITDYYNFLDRNLDTGIWSVPIYDKINDKLMFFTHNHTNKDDLQVMVIYNEKLFFFNLNKKQWKLVTIGDINTDGKLNVWVENKNNLNVDFDMIDIDTFKKHNYITYVEN